MKKLLFFTLLFSVTFPAALANQRLPILGLQCQIDDALIAAVKNNNMTKIDFLIGGGARVNSKECATWKTPLMCAIEFGKATTMENIVQKLIHADADVNDYNLHGETPLIVAAKKGSQQIPLPVFELLLKNGADKNWRDTLPEKSALDYAKQNKDRALINLLTTQTS